MLRGHTDAQSSSNIVNFAGDESSSATSRKPRWQPASRGMVVLMVIARFLLRSLRFVIPLAIIVAIIWVAGAGINSVVDSFMDDGFGSLTSTDVSDVSEAELSGSVEGDAATAVEAAYRNALANPELRSDLIEMFDDNAIAPDTGDSASSIGVDVEGIVDGALSSALLSDIEVIDSGDEAYVTLTITSMDVSSISWDVESRWWDVKAAYGDIDPMNIDEWWTLLINACNEVVAEAEPMSWSASVTLVRMDDGSWAYDESEVMSDVRFALGA